MPILYEDIEVLFNQAVEAALESKGKVLLGTSTAWILLINDVKRPKKQNEAAVAIALAVARSIARSQNFQYRFTSGPLITTSNDQELEMWTCKQVKPNTLFDFHSIADDPLQTAIIMLIEQIDYERQLCVSKFGVARNYGIRAHGNEECERRFAAIGFGPDFVDEVEEDLKVLKKLAVESRYRSCMAKAPWKRRARLFREAVRNTRMTLSDFVRLRGRWIPIDERPWRQQ